MEENYGGREAEDGFCTGNEAVHSCCEGQGRLEETGQWPYSPRGELGLMMMTISKSFVFSKSFVKPKTSFDLTKSQSGRTSFFCH